MEPHGLDGHAVLVALHLQRPGRPHVEHEAAGVVGAHRQEQPGFVKAESRNGRRVVFSAGPRRPRHVQLGTRLAGAGVPHLHCPVFAARGHQLRRGGDVHDVQRGRGRHPRRLELAVLQVEAVDFVAVPDDEDLSGRAVVHHVPPKPGHARAVVPAVRGVELQVAVSLQKHHLGVVVAEHGKLDDVRVHVALKLDAELLQVEHLHHGRVGADGRQVQSVFGRPQPLRGGVEPKVLQQLHAAPERVVFPRVAPVWSQFRRRQVVHFDAIER